MRRVSISELQKNPSKIFEELPVEIIRYGQTVAIISTPFELGRKFLEHQVGRMPDLELLPGDTKDSVEKFSPNEIPGQIVEPFLPEYTSGYCTKCFGKREVKPVEYNDPDGNTTKETLCAKHVRALEVHFAKAGGGFV